jgi:hypothetical protein
LFTVPTAFDTSVPPICQKKKNSSTNASTTFTAGPAAITTTRFQTGCE